jgi:hypothetical protein
VSLFQSNLRKQIRNLPKILNFVKKIHYYSELFTSLLNGDPLAQHGGRAEEAPFPLTRAALLQFAHPIKDNQMHLCSRHKPRSQREFLQNIVGR